LLNIELQAPEFKSSAITAASKHVNAKIGSKFKIICGVKGQRKPTVRFYNGTMLLGPPATDSRVEISSAMLRIIDAKKEDSGSYRCEVSNAAGIQSLTFNVSIVPKGI